MRSAALAPFAPQEVLPGPDVQTDADLERAAGDLGTTIFHPVGTCAMGRVDAGGRASDPMTVLDPGLRLRGVARLRVVDASLMPRLIGGNTNAPTIMMAERIADLMRELTCAV